MIKKKIRNVKLEENDEGNLFSKTPFLRNKSLSSSWELVTVKIGRDQNQSCTWLLGLQVYGLPALHRPMSVFPVSL